MSQKFQDLFNVLFQKLLSSFLSFLRSPSIQALADAKKCSEVRLTKGGSPSPSKAGCGLMSFGGHHAMNDLLKFLRLKHSILMETLCWQISIRRGFLLYAIIRTKMKFHSRDASGPPFLDCSKVPSSWRCGSLTWFVCFYLLPFFLLNKHILSILDPSLLELDPNVLTMCSYTQ